MAFTLILNPNCPSFSLWCVIWQNFLYGWIPLLPSSITLISILPSTLSTNHNTSLSFCIYFMHYMDRKGKIYTIYTTFAFWNNCRICNTKTKKMVINKIRLNEWVGNFIFGYLYCIPFSLYFFFPNFLLFKDVEFNGGPIYIWIHLPATPHAPFFFFFASLNTSPLVIMIGMTQFSSLFLSLYPIWNPNGMEFIIIV